jgi:hypothetical protein
MLRLRIEMAGNEMLVGTSTYIVHYGLWYCSEGGGDGIGDGIEGEQCNPLEVYYGMKGEFDCRIWL